MTDTTTSGLPPAQLSLVTAVDRKLSSRALVYAQTILAGFEFDDLKGRPIKLYTNFDCMETGILTAVAAELNETTMKSVFSLCQRLRLLIPSRVVRCTATQIRPICSLDDTAEKNSAPYTPAYLYIRIHGGQRSAAHLRSSVGPVPGRPISNCCSASL